MGIYVDNSATTRVRPEVREAMLPYLDSLWGNPSSLHEPGHLAHNAINEARADLSALLNCASEEIYFTASGTLSNNIAILGRARFAEANGLGKHLITTEIEHASALGPSRFLEACGWQVTYLPVNDQGLVEVADLKRAIKADTTLISIGWANNEIGSVQPIYELAQLAKEAGIFFHTDAIQVAGKLPIDLQQLPVTSLSISGHKFHGPKGIAALFVRAGYPVMPITFGGGQEQGLCPGTEPVANIVGIGKAARLSLDELQKTEALLRAMQKELMERLSSLPNIQFTGPSDIDQRLPGHVSLVAPDRSGESLVLRCDLRGIYLSSGSACHGRAIEPSHVLNAIGLSHQEALGALRITLGKFNTFAECEEVASVLSSVLRCDENTIQVNRHSGAISSTSI